MPPKSQKMGSITHNSAEVNQKSGKSGGMFSKLRSSLSTSGGKTTAGTTRNKKPAELARSVPGGSTVGGSTVGGASKTSAAYTRRGANSFTNGDSTVEIPMELQKRMQEGGIPNSITALVDAASCLSDEFDASVMNYPYRGQSDFRPSNVEPRHNSHDVRGSMMSSGLTSSAYGTSAAASQALSNMKLSGQSNEMGQANMVQVQNSGYNNYTYTNYTEENYEDGGGPDNYDESGGGLFDDSYMKSSRNNVNAHQPPRPDHGYNRRSSAESDYLPSSYGDSRGYSHAQERGYNRRSSSTDEMPDASYYRSSSSTYETDNGGYGGSLPGLPERSSTDSSAPYRRASIEYDSRGLRDQFRTSGRHQSFSNNSQQTPVRRPTVQRSNSQRVVSNPKWPTSTKDDSSNDISDRTESQNCRRSVVNNTGRPSDIEESSRNKSPNSHMSGSLRLSNMSTTGKNNPNWFSEEQSSKNSRTSNSESTQQMRNAEAQDIISSRQNFRGDDDDRTMATMGTLGTKGLALKPSAINKAKGMTYPSGDVTIVYTDVQGSTSFWEACPSDMKKATDIHDMIMRQCYTNHSGYEISTEGDSFNLAFQHPMDALAFALQAQLKLYNADWPPGITRHQDGKDEPALKSRGFRVRFGIHHGPTERRVHEMTGRMNYSGEGVKIAKSVEAMCHGGQILTTMETWKAVSGMAERYLGRPQVLDCGEHLLFETKNQTQGSGGGYTTTRYTRRIMQLVPSELAFDFFEARGRRDVTSEDGKMSFEIKDASSVNGRLFPPLTSKRQLTTCFLNAPYANGRVTICFVYTVGLDDNPDTRPQNLKVLSKYVRKQLLLLNPPGYECQEDNGCWMLAFDRMAHAVTFGLQLKTTLQGVDDLVPSPFTDRNGMFKVGILSGPFTSMGPHKTTGMADYFGPGVNRAARVASNCEPGQVCVGIPLTNGVTADPPDFGPTVNVRLQGIKKLKGITIDVAIFECSTRRVETPYR